VLGSCDLAVDLDVDLNVNVNTTDDVAVDNRSKRLVHLARSLVRRVAELAHRAVEVNVNVLIAGYFTQGRVALFVIFGVMNTRISVRSSFSRRFLNNQPSTGRSPKNGTFLYARPVLRV